ncbi:MAG: precorrin-6y C5,15-methyltransferase (decarboxylating) subunit CbiE [Rhodospirillales bacterium]|nr:precorrin-6y C5,15-methyltransferase (decarboxylating) subunit CbiE [Rhodospirillales bacterium]
MTPWITIIGIGDDGLSGLAPAARALIQSAEFLVGGDRHQAMVAETGAERLTWVGGLATAMDAMAAWRGRRVVVLATGDPMWYGAGANLTRRFDAAEITVVPAPGAFSLAAARMLWPLADVDLLTIHGRPIETLVLALAPSARWLVLSRDGESPAEVARLLTAHGYGPSVMTVLEHLGAPRERRIDGIAETWNHGRCADLNTLAIDCRPGPRARVLPRVPGLPDDAFESDGQLTKREVRAATIAALRPLPGQVLWDVGAGSGSIAIEWLRALPRSRWAGQAEARAVAIERNADRCAMISRNALALGVPQLAVVQGDAKQTMATLEARPNTVFVGGGVGEPELLTACWDALKRGGRLVANAVTMEGEAALFAFRGMHGGDLTRIAISRAEPVGGLTGFKPLMPVTQYIGDKS